MYALIVCEMFVLPLFEENVENMCQGFNDFMQQVDNLVCLV